VPIVECPKALLRDLRIYAAKKTNNERFLFVPIKLCNLSLIEDSVMHGRVRAGLNRVRGLSTARDVNFPKTIETYRLPQCGRLPCRLGICRLPPELPPRE
jgi:hypothetical protein